MKKGGYVYILANRSKSVLYIGVTEDLNRRMYEHRNKINTKCFTAKYNCNILLYYNGFHTIEEAIYEEKRLKAGSRKKKQDLIYAMNPMWLDLYDTIEG